MISDHMTTIDLSKTRTDIFKNISSISTIKCKLENYVSQRNEFLYAEMIKTEEFLIKCPNANGEHTRWILEIRPKGSGGAFLNVLNLDQFDVTTHIGASILDRSGQRRLTKTYQQEFDKHNKKLAINEISYTTLKNDSDNLMPNGELTLVIDFTLAATSSASDPKNVKLKTPIGQDNTLVRESFMELFNSKEMSDVQIRCEDQTFDAHQLILSTRSPVFQRMFQTEMKEKKSGQVDIEDLKPEVVSEMLKFIYSWECASINDSKTSDQDVIDLIEAADKYQLELLKHLCEDALCTRIKVESSLKFLIFGDMYGAVKLKEVAMELVRVNVVKFMGSEEWKDCLKNRPSLVEDIIKAMAQKNY